MDKTNVGDRPFSVLMCVYEGDNDIYFEEALKSITQDQELKPSQVVLVVDGPISSGKEIIISKFTNIENIAFDVIKLQSNVGQGVALNKGLPLCRYNYVARMDSDDVSLSNRFKVQINYVYENPSVDVLSSYVEEFNSDGLKSLRKLPLNSSDISNYSKTRSPVNHGACVFKRDKVLSVGGYNTYVQVQDYLLFVNMIRAGCIIRNTDDILLKVRMPGGYGKKAGWLYFKEEVSLAADFYHMGHIGVIGLFRNILIRAIPRLFSQKIINYIYKHLLR